MLLSNLFWSYKPEWYDLAFNLWACTLHVRDTSYSFDQLRDYIEKWLDLYREIPIVQEDRDFDRKIYTILLERTIGAILVDLGVHDDFGQKENQETFHHLLGLHQQLFDYYEARLNELN